jgi:hypothetical protein
MRGQFGKACWGAAALLGLLMAPQRAAAQARTTEAVAFGVTGAGCFGDDEGWLGCGLVLGAGGGIRLGNHLQIEGVVSTVPHEQIASITWEGRATVATGRVLYRFGSRQSRVRWFAGAGFGVGTYNGTRTDTIYSSRGPIGTETISIESTGPAAELGAGVDIAVGERLFIRPEGWSVAIGGTPEGGLEPTFLVPRVSLTVGVRF